MFKFSTLFLLPVFFSLPLWAQQPQEIPRLQNPFYSLLNDYINKCSNQCASPYSEEIIYSRDAHVKLPLLTPYKTALEQAANDQSQIWGDTILEGDYAANGPTRLDEVKAIFSHQELIGFRIVYSESAWYTGECDYDGSDESLAACQSGRISEGSFISPNFDVYVRDESAYANFQEGL